MRRLSIIAVVFVFILILNSCSPLRIGIAALRSTSDFIALESDKRVLYEPGAADFAAEVAGYLPEAVATVEREQYRPFAEPIRVYVCATDKSFVSHTGFEARAGVTTRLFLSAEMINKIQDGNTARSLLTHELSHLHILQRRGVFGYGGIPAWFKEGLAVEVSGGAPAVDVTESEAARAILAGDHIEPDASGSILFPKLWDHYGLKPHMFYRQSSMFVAYIKGLDDVKFRTFVLALEDGKDFRHSFKAIYGVSVVKSWEEFNGRLTAIGQDAASVR